MSVPSEVLAVVRQWVEKAESDLTNAEHTLTLETGCPYDTNGITDLTHRAGQGFRLVRPTAKTANRLGTHAVGCAEKAHDKPGGLPHCVG